MSAAAILRQQTRVVGELPIACPAGERIGETLRGSGCRCRIEHSTIVSVGQGRSLASFCMTDYQACPTWRARREAELEDRDREMDDELRRDAAEG